MSRAILSSIGSFLALAWGILHLFPTTSVVSAFGEISADNRRTITMKWITKGVALIFIGVLVAMGTLLDRSSLISRTVC